MSFRKAIRSYRRGTTVRHDEDDTVAPAEPGLAKASSKDLLTRLFTDLHVEESPSDIDELITGISGLPAEQFKAEALRALAHRREPTSGNISTGQSPRCALRQLYVDAEGAASASPR